MRFAIYFAPGAQSVLWRFGSGVLGYDAATGEDMPFSSTAGLEAARWLELTAEPRRYGFHATLKAPFALREEFDQAMLLARTRELASQLAPVVLDGLKVAEIGRFIALVPVAPSLALQTLAAETVERLDDLRAPLSEADRARRLASPLTPRQIAYLDRYGYPYVLDEFRFHMTLTGPIADEALRAAIRERLAEAYAEAVPAGPVMIDDLAVYAQDLREARFRIIDRCALNG